MSRAQRLTLDALAGWCVVLLISAACAQGEVNIGSRRGLFVDQLLIDRLERAQLVLHSPQPREIGLKFDQPWEGLYCGYETVLKDGDILRFYYRGMPVARHTLDVEVTCVAESRDGIQWTRPKLGLFEVQGTKDNNVVLARHRGCHNFAPFVDANPAAPADQPYKAFGGTREPGLIAFASPDGIHWRELQPEPAITQGAFDSQNNAFWSEIIGDRIEHTVSWKSGSDVGKLAGQTVRLRFELQDADLYSLQCGG